MDIYDFVVWFGSVAGSSIVASFLLERWAYFKGLASEAKMWVSFGSMALLGILSHLTLTYVPAETLQAIAPYFAILASAFTSVFSGSLFHRFDK